ncbi:B12-binding domain-containing radical SAM protein [Desulfitobacterium dichloroeliminans]|uniref:B12-binding domain-containing radical SAM protein n=1 Tax=Desulfitobacterium dichloroeliminans TaxID=233055 RepID=UPI00030B9F9E|nr:radical SAM protein [Desulfitobacterium dichloroeliminans]
MRVEPLELGYLQAVSEAMGVEAYIVDDLFGFPEPQDIWPEAIVLTGYNTAEGEILKEADAYKKIYPEAKIIVGGVHVELNRESFQTHPIDFVIHSQDLTVFQKVLEFIRGDIKEIPCAGVDVRRLAADGSDAWCEGTRLTVKTPQKIKPTRLLTGHGVNRTRYLDKEKIALVKNRMGCPYSCDFCYCKLINDGVQVKGDYQQMLREVKEAPAKYHWVVDDVFLASRQEALDYIKAYGELTQEEGEMAIKLIAYLRADFLAQESDLLGKLKECGLDEVIVGFEATENRELEEYNKLTDALDYPKVIELLKENDIDLTALFMVRPDYSLADFKRLNRFIAKNRLSVYTISILTPIKGTRNYEDKKSQLLTEDPRKFDFLHRVLPSKLPKAVFYLLFYGLHWRLLKSRRIHAYLGQLFAHSRLTRKIVPLSADASR